MHGSSFVAGRAGFSFKLILAGTPQSISVAICAFPLLCLGAWGYGHRNEDKRGQKELTGKAFAFYDDTARVD